MQNALQYVCFSLSHFHTKGNTSGDSEDWYNHWEHFGVRCPAQGHFNVWTGGAGDRTANPAVS